MYLKLKTIFLVLLLLFLVSSLCFAASHDEWQRAWNDAVIHGEVNQKVTYKADASVYGFVDILTEDYAIEVDHVNKFKEGIGQALFYADITGKKPGLALYMDDKKDTKNTGEIYKYVEILANKYGVKVWLINNDVDLNKKKSPKWKFW